MKFHLTAPGETQQSLLAVSEHTSTVAHPACASAGAGAVSWDFLRYTSKLRASLLRSSFSSVPSELLKSPSEPRRSHCAPSKDSRTAHAFPVSTLPASTLPASSLMHASEVSPAKRSLPVVGKGSERFNQLLRAADDRMAAALASSASPTDPEPEHIRGERPNDSVPGTFMGDLFAIGSRYFPCIACNQQSSGGHLGNGARFVRMHAYLNSTASMSADFEMPCRSGDAVSSSPQVIRVTSFAPQAASLNDLPFALYASVQLQYHQVQVQVQVQGQIALRF